MATDNIEAQIEQVGQEIHRTEDAVERYLLASEAGTLPETSCGDRVRSLATITALRCRRTEVSGQLEEQPDSPSVISDIDLDQIRDCIDEIFSCGDEGRPARKALLRELIAETTVDSRAPATQPSGSPTGHRFVLCPGSWS